MILELGREGTLEESDECAESVLFSVSHAFIISLLIISCLIITLTLVVSKAKLSKSFEVPGMVFEIFLQS